MSNSRNRIRTRKIKPEHLSRVFEDIIVPRCNYKLSKSHPVVNHAYRRRGKGSSLRSPRKNLQSAPSLSISISNHFFFFLIARNDDIVWFSLNFTAQEEFEELCFRFGIELDDVVSISLSLPVFFWFINIEMVNLLFELFQTTEKAIIRKEKHLEDEGDDDEEVIYKIEVPANRYFTILYTNI